MNFRFLIFIFFSILSFWSSSGQEQIDFTPVSPSASSIATYVDYPVDLINGIPNIEIPLFDIDTKMGSIPFKLSYHVGKIKSSEFTGSTGLGWTLTPDLGITRSGRGNEDINSYFPGSIFNDYDPNCLRQLQIAKGEVDLQPDDFYYSLLGKAGKFLYNKNKSFSTIPYQPIRINRSGINSFNIVDSDGAIYYYGDYSAPNSIGQGEVVEFSELNGNYSRDSWKITSITSGDGSETIDFLYGDYIAHNILDFSSQYEITKPISSASGGQTSTKLSVKRPMFYGSPYSSSQTNIGWLYLKPETSGYPSPGYYQEYTGIGPYNNSNSYSLTDFERTIYDTGNPPSPAPNLTDGGGPIDDPSVLKERTVNEYLLDEIRFNNGKVTYQYDSNDRLQRLYLYQKKGGTYYLLKYAQFSYSNLNNDAVGDYNFAVGGRFTLDRVELYNTNNVLIKSYGLEYTTRSSRYIPKGINIASDPWGFPYEYGVQSFPELRYGLQVPTGSGTTKINVTLGKSLIKDTPQYSAPDLPPLLRKINYPTGGGVEFLFERNKFSLNGETLFGGGFRIKSIHHMVDEYTIGKAQIFRYGVDTSGVGILKYTPQKSDFIYDQVIKEYDGSLNIKTQVQPSPFKGMYFSGGTAVLYPEVTIFNARTYGDGEIVEQKGKTKYKYSISGINNIRQPFTPLQYDYRDEWKRYYLERKQVYDKNENLLAEEKYHYQNYYKDTIPVVQSFQRYVSQYPSDDDFDICNANISGYDLNGNSYSPLEFIQYDITTGIQKLIKTEVIDYRQSGEINAVTDLRYNDYFFLAEKEIKSSKGTNTTVSEQFFYPTDISSTVNNQMVSANIIGTPIKIENRENSSLLRTTEISYKNWGGGLFAPESVDIQKIGGQQYNISETRSYDNYGNPIEVSRENGSPVFFLWGYNGSYVIAKIKNSNYTDLYNALGNLKNIDESDLTAINNLRANSNFRNSQITTYTYEPLIGISTITDSRNRTITYNYDNFGRLKFIKDHDGNLVEDYKYNYKGE